MNKNTFAALAAKWRGASSREQNLVRVALFLLASGLIGWTLVALPLRVLLNASQHQHMLEADLQKMQGMKTQAQRLQELPNISREDAIRVLQVSTSSLGASAQLDVSANRATLTLRAAPAEALAKWLAQVRTSAQAQPTEVRLTRVAGPVAAWDGLLVLGLPAN
jgi:general secretion pathway protein M